MSETVKPREISPWRLEAIYDAVYDRLLDLRIEVAKRWPESDVAKEVDGLLFEAMGEAGQAAIQAAENGKHSRFWRS